MTKVLSIGTDRGLFKEGSAPRERSIGYSEKTEQFHAVVFTLKKEGFVAQKVNNLFIYPTNSVSQWLYVLDAYRLCKKIIRDNGLDKNNSVLSTQDPFQTGFVGVRLSKKFDLPLQVQIHTDFLSNHFSGFFNTVRKIIAGYVLPNAQGIRVVSSVISDSVKTKYSNLKARIDVLPVFVDIEMFDHVHPISKDPEGSRFFKKNIFMASRLTKEKRFDVALKTLKKVTEKDNEVGLTICGKGPEKDNIEDLEKQLGLVGKIKIRGWEDSVVLISRYKLSDIFLMTSEFEGYGMTLIEAGAAGCPIVTTNVGIAKTDLFKNGINSYVCPVGDIDCLSKSIIDLLEYPEKRQLFKDGMRASIKSISMSRDEYVNRYVGLLEKLIKHV